MRQILLDQIRGAGAFRRFKQALQRYDIAEDWYRYRAAELEALAIEWLDSYHISYQRDDS